jgi:hypothetical protein
MGILRTVIRYSVPKVSVNRSGVRFGNHFGGVSSSWSGNPRADFGIGPARARMNYGSPATKKPSDSSSNQSSTGAIEWLNTDEDVKKHWDNVPPEQIPWEIRLFRWQDANEKKLEDTHAYSFLFIFLAILFGSIWLFGTYGAETIAFSKHWILIQAVPMTILAMITNNWFGQLLNDLKKFESQKVYGALDIRIPFEAHIRGYVIATSPIIYAVIVNTTNFDYWLPALVASLLVTPIGYLPLRIYLAPQLKKRDADLAMRVQQREQWMLAEEAKKSEIVELRKVEKAERDEIQRVVDIGEAEKEFREVWNLLSRIDIATENFAAEIALKDSFSYEIKVELQTIFDNAVTILLKTKPSNHVSQCRTHLSTLVQMVFNSIDNPFGIVPKTVINVTDAPIRELFKASSAIMKKRVESAFEKLTELTQEVLYQVDSNIEISIGTDSANTTSPEKEVREAFREARLTLTNYQSSLNSNRASYYQKALTELSKDYMEKFGFKDL